MPDNPSNYLSSLAQGAGDYFGGSLLSGLGGAAASALLGNTGRMSDERFQEAQGRMDLDNQRQIGRSTAFLEGVTPAQANAHNQYQDMTYGQDTQRGIDRVQDQSKGLGMSNWELLGQGSQSGAPVGPDSAPQQSQTNSYLSTMVPLETAKIQQQTALAQTKMNNDTTLKISGQSTAEGQLPKQQLEQLKAGIAGTQQSIDESRTRQFLSAMDFILKASPTETIGPAGITVTQTPGWRAITKALGYTSAQAGEPSYLNPNNAALTSVRNTLRQLPPEEYTQLQRDLVKEMGMLGAGGNAAGTALQLGTKLGQGAGAAFKGAGKFLNKMKTNSIAKNAAANFIPGVP